MTRARMTAALLGMSVAGLMAAPGVLAATPKTIYNDYAAHGKLTKAYSRADLQRALRSTVVQGYGHGHKPGFKPHVIVVVTPPVQHGGLPFTGMDLGLMSFGAVLLLGFGAALRRFARSRS